MMIWELNLTARCRFWTQSQLIRFQSAVSSEDEQAAWLPSKLLHRRKMKTNVDEKAFRGWILSTRLLLCHINAEMKKKKSKRNKECCEILNPHQNQIICSLACGWTVFILSVRKLEMKLRRRWKKKKNVLCLNLPKDRSAKKKRSSEPNKKKQTQPYSICDSVFVKRLHILCDQAYLLWHPRELSSNDMMHCSHLSSAQPLIISVLFHPFYFFFWSIKRGSRPRRPNRSHMCFWFENLQ